MNNLPKIVAVIGPTASGKTTLGIQLAQHFNGEIISADAKQVYKGMDIGTAKELHSPIHQHLIDIKLPEERITVAEYQNLAYKVIDQLKQEKKLPILVGGSGLYAESVINGYTFAGPSSKQAELRYNCLKLGIFHERESLKARVTDRLKERLNLGLLDEIAGLLASGVSAEWLRSCGLEYRYFTDQLLGILTPEEALQQCTLATNQFIKRQYTWWRRHPDVHWLKSYEEGKKVVQQFVLT